MVREGFVIKVRTREIVSNSEIIKNYKACREKAAEFGKIFIWKNSKPDAVLFSVDKYEKLAPVIEYAESLSETEYNSFIKSLSKKA